MAVIPKFEEKEKKINKPVAIPINNFYPHTYIGQDFDPNSVITQIT
jgi:hypothetical protein